MTTQWLRSHVLTVGRTPAPCAPAPPSRAPPIAPHDPPPGHAPAHSLRGARPHSAPQKKACSRTTDVPSARSGPGKQDIPTRSPFIWPKIPPERESSALARARRARRSHPHRWVPDPHRPALQTPPRARNRKKKHPRTGALRPSASGFGRINRLPAPRSWPGRR